MSHTSGQQDQDGGRPKPTPPEIKPEIAYQTGAILAKNNQHPTYHAAEREFLSRYGDRQLKAFEQGYYDGSCGYA